MISCHSSKNNTKDDSYKENVSSKMLGLDVGKHDNRKLYKEAQSWLGTPYRYGGNTRRGVDCSGMVQAIYKEVYNIALERNSAKIMENNCTEIRKGSLEEGDLIFFATGSKTDKITHVGLYLKDGKFIHASSSKGVVISSIYDRYYVSHYICSGKVKSK